MTIRPNQVRGGGAREVGEFNKCTSRVGRGQVGAGKRSGIDNRIREIRFPKVGTRQVGSHEVRTSKVLSDEVAAGKIVETEANTAQVVGLIAGGGVELRSGDAANILKGVVIVGGQEFSPTYLGASEVSAGEFGPVEGCIGEVLPDEVRPGKIDVIQVNAVQVMGLVAGCGVELRKSDSGSIRITKVRPTYVGAGEVGVGEFGPTEGCIGKVLTGEVGASQVAPI